MNFQNFIWRKIGMEKKSDCSSSKSFWVLRLAVDCNGFIRSGFKRKDKGTTWILCHIVLSSKYAIFMLFFFYLLILQEKKNYIQTAGQKHLIIWCFMGSNYSSKIWKLIGEEEVWNYVIIYKFQVFSKLPVCSMRLYNLYVYSKFFFTWK